MEPAPYPLLFSPIYKTKVWGGRRLERLGRRLPGDERTPIGEAWEVVDLARTSVSGGGGSAEHSVVANGPCAGVELGELWTRWGAALAGRPRAPADADFPLLVKLLDASTNLSLQVHPTESYARAHPGAQLKTEAWYVLDAEPGAALYKGLARGVGPAQLRTALASGSRESLEPLLVRVPARAGDCHYLPSGTCHALGAGILVLEVQDPSDTTFRLYDWGRTDRPLHVEEALECLGSSPASSERASRASAPRTARSGAFRRTSLVECDAFALERVEAAQGEHPLPTGTASIWNVLTGGGEILGAAFEPVPIARGATVLLPAGLSAARLRLDAASSWIEISLPPSIRV
jgi:mannose-6-phosphate isomerase